MHSLFSPLPVFQHVNFHHNHVTAKFAITFCCPHFPGRTTRMIKPNPFDTCVTVYMFIYSFFPTHFFLNKTKFYWLESENLRMHIFSLRTYQFELLICNFCFTFLSAYFFFANISIWNFNMQITFHIFQEHNFFLCDHLNLNLNMHIMPNIFPVHIFLCEYPNLIWYAS